jgi:hypothetical protein
MLFVWAWEQSDRMERRTTSAQPHILSPTGVDPGDLPLSSALFFIQRSRATFFVRLALDKLWVPPDANNKRGEPVWRVYELSRRLLRRPSSSISPRALASMGLSSIIARAARRLGFGKNNAFLEPPPFAPRPEATVQLWEEAMDASIGGSWDFSDLHRSDPHAYSNPSYVQPVDPESGFPVGEARLVPPPKEKYAILTPGERWWRDMSGNLETKGYRLRSRFQPGWMPSWQGTGRAFETCEDGRPRSIQERYVS